LIYDYYTNRIGQEVVERDDGLLDPSETLPAYYFAPFRRWAAHERRAMRFVRGRVLDVGSGAGRVALYLQRRGVEVLGIDVSPLAIQVCKLRGLKEARLLPAAGVNQLDSKFDTILMFGNNFGLFSGYKRGRTLLNKFYGITSESARIIAESTDPYQTNNRTHIAYHRRNRRRGRMSGQVRIRIRYRTYATPWFDYLLVSKVEMRELITGTGWRIERFLNSSGPQYIAIIKKTEK
jgi:SAM-dependent methyltransferase